MKAYQSRKGAYKTKWKRTRVKKRKITKKTRRSAEMAKEDTWRHMTMAQAILVGTAKQRWLPHGPFFCLTYPQIADNPGRTHQTGRYLPTLSLFRFHFNFGKFHFEEVRINSPTFDCASFNSFKKRNGDQKSEVSHPRDKIKSSQLTACILTPSCWICAGL